MPHTFPTTDLNPWGGSPDPRRAPSPGLSKFRRDPDGRPGGRLRSVPSMGRISLDERSQSEPMTATVAEPQGLAVRRKLKEAEGKLSTEGTRTGSEARGGRRAGSEQRSPKVIKTRQVEPVGTRGKILNLTWGDLLHESGGEVSSGRSSGEGR